VKSLDECCVVYVCGESLFVRGENLLLLLPVFIKLVFDWY